MNTIFFSFILVKIGVNYFLLQYSWKSALSSCDYILTMKLCVVLIPIKERF